MSYTCKNYRDEGGNRDVIGGAILFLPGAKTEMGGTNHAFLRYLPDSEADTVAKVVADYNSLLAQLRACGILESAVPAITILTQPEAANAGEDVSVSVEASVSDGDALSYQWYSSASDVTTGGDEVSGATSPTYDVPSDLASSTYFYCVITAGKTGVSATSNNALITVS